MNVIEILSIVLPFLGTLLLAVLNWKLWRQQKRQSDLQALAYLPQIVIESQKGDTYSDTPRTEEKHEWFTFRNSGDVPFRVSISLTLAEVTDVSRSDKLLDPSVGYESISEEYKFTDGSWENETYFLNPGDEKRWGMGVLTNELMERNDGEFPDNWCFLRVDAELESTLDPAQSQKITRIFNFITDHPMKLVSITFDQARSRWIEQHKEDVENQRSS